MISAQSLFESRSLAHSWDCVPRYINTSLLQACVTQFLIIWIDVVIEDEPFSAGFIKLHKNYGIEYIWITPEERFIVEYHTNMRSSFYHACWK